MAMAHIFAVILLGAAAAAVADDPNQTVHDIITRYGFPPGLIPDSVVSSKIDSGGNFEVVLAAPCHVKFSPYTVHYDQKITGRIYKGHITELSGISAEQFIFIVPVVEIIADDSRPDVLCFRVGFLGIITQTLPVSEFEKVPTCTAKEFAPGRRFFPEEYLRLPSSEV